MLIYVLPGYHGITLHLATPTAAGFPHSAILPFVYVWIFFLAQFGLAIGQIIFLINEW